MAPTICFNNGNACEATTWVCKAPDCSLPYYGEALSEAERKGMHLGINLESRSVVVHFAQPRPSQSVQRTLAVVLGKGGSTKKAIEGMESLDLYHAESWGLVKLSAPAMPEYFDHVVEEDELSEVESKAEDELCSESEEAPQVDAGPSEASVPEVFELAAPSPDLFALVVQPVKTTIPSFNKALLMETSHQKELREAMEKAGGPLSKDLKDALFPRGKEHAKDVQEEARALIRMKETEAIFWITRPPAFITIYGKPQMHNSRRVEWIKWKADKLNMQLTLPVFMAMFKQITFYEDSDTRMQKFKIVVKLWQGAPLDWKGLPADERNLISSINVGKNDCYCKNCKCVLDPKATTQYCSQSCASYFCGCGKMFEVKMIDDYEQRLMLQNRVGPYRDLVKLVEMLNHKAEVVKYQNASDVNPKFDELTQKRKAEKCCEGVEGCVDKRWCRRCLDEFQGINYIKNCVWDISSGKVTWGHCEEAARRLKIMAEIPMPQMEQKVCNAKLEACQPARKKARTF